MKDRVHHLSVVIVETFKPNNENSSDDVIMKAAKGIEEDITELLRYAQICGRSLIANYVYFRTLETIKEDLDKITAQGRWKIGIFSDLNTTAVDGCLDRLSTALEQFKVRLTSDVYGLGA